MIVMLEGRDGTGKTSLGKAIAEQHGWGYLHIDDGWSHNDVIDEWVALSVLETLGASGRSFIYDRSVISGVCYSDRYLSIYDATMSAWEWYSCLLRAGYDVALVRVTAEQAVRDARDPSAIAADKYMLWDVDEVSRVIGGLLESSRYIELDTSHIGIQAAVEIVTEGLKCK